MAIEGDSAGCSEAPPCPDESPPDVATSNETYHPVESPPDAAPSNADESPPPGTPVDEPIPNETGEPPSDVATPDATPSTIDVTAATPESTDGEIMVLDTERREVSTLSIAELKIKLKEMGLPTTGKKDTLLRRYRASESE